LVGVSVGVLVGVAVFTKVLVDEGLLVTVELGVKVELLVGV
jgi:hypothetical protein